MDVVQHNEETFEDRIVIFFFSLFLLCSDLHITFHLAVWWAETMERFFKIYVLNSTLYM